MADYGIDAAAECNSLFIDGTFSTCPFPFYQTITLLGKSGEKVHLLGWALVPNKQQSTYKDVLEMLCDTYMEKTYIPTTLPIRKKSVMYNPDWTCLYENDDGTVTNNFSESNNARLKRKLGLHPSLFKFLLAMKQEAAASEVKWLQRNCPAPKKRP